MKIKKIFLVGIILLAIITLGAVSAQDAQELTVAGQGDDLLEETPEDTVETASDIEEPVSESTQLNIEIPEKAKWGETIKVNASVNLPSEDLDANIYVYDSYSIDDDNDGYVTQDGFWLDNTTSFSFTLRGFGDHNLEFRLMSYEEELIGNPVFKTITIEGYTITAIPSSENSWDSDAWIDLSIPLVLTEDIKITVNGDAVYYNYYDKEDEFRYDDYIVIRAEDLKYGTNNLKIEYPGDDNGNAAGTFYATFYCDASINIPNRFEYNGKENITLNLPSDAKGKLQVRIDNENQTPVALKDGKAAFTMPVLDIGEHYIEAEYIDDSKYSVEERSGYYNIAHKITVPRFIPEDGGYISVEMPEKYNGTAYAYIEEYIDETEEYNNTNLSEEKIVNGKAKLFVKLDESKWIWVKVVCGELEIEREVFVRVSPYDCNWTMNITTREIIKTEEQNPIFIDNYVDADENQFVLKVDGKVMPFKVSGNSVYIDASELELGTHNFELAFLGDGYYLPVNRTGSFSVDTFAVEIEKNPDMDNPGDINVYTPVGMGGTVTVKVDGKTIFSEKVNPADYYDYTYVSVDSYTYGIHTITVNYEGREKTYKINASYDLGCDDVARYGGDIIYLYAPIKVTQALTVRIDGAEQKIIQRENGEGRTYYVIETAKDLKVGNHSISVSYKGDSRYPAKSFETTLQVRPTIELDSRTLKKGDGISLILPEDAKGNLTLDIRRINESDFHRYANVKAAGDVHITFDDLAYGQYYCKVNYTGDDYKIVGFDEGEESFTINPQITCPSEIIVGDTYYVTVNAPGGEGNVTVLSDTFEITTYLVNGETSIALCEIHPGTKSLTVIVELNPDEDGFFEEYYYEYPVITVYNPLTAKDAKPLYSANEKYSVQIKDANGNPVKSGKVHFEIREGKLYLLEKTVNINNGVATLPYKITQGVKTYTIKTTYNKVSVTKKLAVKHVVTLKTVTVKKSAKKLTLQATLAKVNGKYLKSKKVTFKFNGKTYKAKTNKKGVAKVTIKSSVLKKLKVGKKITYQATYIKDTVKKTAKVKK